MLDQLSQKEDNQPDFQTGQAENYQKFVVSDKEQSDNGNAENEELAEIQVVPTDCPHRNCSHGIQEGSSLGFGRKSEHEARASDQSKNNSVERQTGNAPFDHGSIEEASVEVGQESNLNSKPFEKQRRFVIQQQYCSKDFRTVKRGVLLPKQGVLDFKTSRLYSK